MKFFKHKHGEAQESIKIFYNNAHALNARALTKTGKILNVHSSMNRKIDKRLTAIVLAFPLLNR